MNGASDSLPRPPLTVVVFTAEAERLHYAFVMAATAAALGRPARLFFAGPGIDALMAGLVDAADGPMAAPQLQARGVATLGELRAACGDLQVGLLACEMALRVRGLTGARLPSDLGVVVAGAASLFDADDGSVLFVS